MNTGTFSSDAQDRIEFWLIFCTIKFLIDQCNLQIYRVHGVYLIGKNFETTKDIKGTFFLLTEQVNFNIMKDIFLFFLFHNQTSSDRMFCVPI